jgi:DNA-binding PadR family transcriptional regulator
MPRRPSLAVVAVLNAVARGVRYGFDVIETTTLPGGTVYPILSRLERDGHLQSDWESVAVARAEKRPPRRYYRITPAGRRWLDAELARVQALTPLKLVPSRKRP